jgi:hypothetical protein
VVLGHHQNPRTGERGLVPPVGADRHLLPYNPGWILAAAEDSILARDFIDEAIARNGQVPHTVHADRGTPMTSQPVSALLVNLGVTRTHSRPPISDDNPFSEAQFKTLKYLHDFPGSFPHLSAARAFCDGFFTEYNHGHRHSGIGWHTPASVHFAATGRSTSPPGDPRRRPRRPPRTLHPTTPTTPDPGSQLDQPTSRRTTEDLTSTVSF